MPKARDSRSPYGPAEGRSIRPDRVAESFKEVLAQEIQRLKDPRVGFVTVTAVHVTPDLRHARVFYTVLGSEADDRATGAALRSARTHLRAALGKKIRLKFLPDLEFVQDVSQQRGDRVETLLRNLGVEEASDGG